MFEDIIAPANPIPQKSTSKKHKPSPIKSRQQQQQPKGEISPFEVIKNVDDVRMLGKILDLCRSKIRKQKRKQRKQKRR